MYREFDFNPDTKSQQQAAVLHMLRELLACYFDKTPIDGIKAIRQMTGLGLKEAKDMWEDLSDRASEYKHTRAVYTTDEEYVVVSTNSWGTSTCWNGPTAAAAMLEARSLVSDSDITRVVVAKVVAKSKLTI